MNQDWVETFVQGSEGELDEPFALCLATALAAVESGWGKRAIRQGEMLNEIGYKAVAGAPSLTVGTREAEDDGQLKSTRAAFRLFASRRAQARSLAYLMRSSVFFEAARLLFVLVFYSAYAPGRDQGARELIGVFNQLAASGRFPGVRPFQMHTAEAEAGVAQVNHAAARRGVRLFAQMCCGGEKEAVR